MIKIRASFQNNFASMRPSKIHPPLITKRLTLFTLGLCDATAEVNRRRETNITPLIRAVQGGRLPLVKILLAQGASVNLADKNGKTPLMHACSQGDTAVAQLLIARGASARAKTNSSRFTALLFAIHDVQMTGRSEGRLVSRGSIRLIQMLIRKGADVNATDRMGNSILSYAVTHNRIDAIRLLLNNGALVNLQSRLGYTPLIKAATCGSADMLRVLLGAGADVNACTRRKHSPLWFARQRKRADIIRLLEEAGAT